MEERERLTVTLTLGFDLLEERHGGGAKVGCLLAQQLRRPPDGQGFFGLGPTFGLAARGSYPAQSNVSAGGLAVGQGGKRRQQAKAAR